MRHPNTVIETGFLLSFYARFFTSFSVHGEFSVDTSDWVMSIGETSSALLSSIFCLWATRSTLEVLRCREGRLSIHSANILSVIGAGLLLASQHGKNFPAYVSATACFLLSRLITFGFHAASFSRDRLFHALLFHLPTLTNLNVLHLQSESAANKQLAIPQLVVLSIFLWPCLPLAARDTPSNTAVGLALCQRLLAATGAVLMLQNEDWHSLTHHIGWYFLLSSQLLNIDFYSLAQRFNQKSKTDISEGTPLLTPGDSQSAAGSPPLTLPAVKPYGVMPAGSPVIYTDPNSPFVIDFRPLPTPGPASLTSSPDTRWPALHDHYLFDAPRSPRRIEPPTFAGAGAATSERRQQPLYSYPTAAPAAPRIPTATSPHTFNDAYQNEIDQALTAINSLTGRKKTEKLTALKDFLSQPFDIDEAHLELLLGTAISCAAPNKSMPHWRVAALLCGHNVFEYFTKENVSKYLGHVHSLSGKALIPETETPLEGFHFHIFLSMRTTLLLQQYIEIFNGYLRGDQLGLHVSADLPSHDRNTQFHNRRQSLLCGIREEIKRVLIALRFLRYGKGIAAVKNGSDKIELFHSFHTGCIETMRTLPVGSSLILPIGWVGHALYACVQHLAVEDYRLSILNRGEGSGHHDQNTANQTVGTYAFRFKPDDWKATGPAYIYWKGLIPKLFPDCLKTEVETLIYAHWMTREDPSTLPYFTKQPVGNCVSANYAATLPFTIPDPSIRNWIQQNEAEQISHLLYLLHSSTDFSEVPLPPLSFQTLPVRPISPLGEEMDLSYPEVTQSEFTLHPNIWRMPQGRETQTGQRGKEFVLIESFILNSMNVEIAHRIIGHLTDLISHPHIMPIRGAYLKKNPGHIVFNALPGAYPLSDDLENSSLPTDSTLKETLIKQLVQGVQHLHQHGFLHGGICPHAIWHNHETLQIAGFYYLRSAAAGSASENQVMPNTPFLAPECQQRGSAALTPAADIYALGWVAWSIFTGRMPNAADQARLKLDAVPPAYHRFIKACVEKDPTLRLPSEALGVEFQYVCALQLEAAHQFEAAEKLHHILKNELPASETRLGLFAYRKHAASNDPADIAQALALFTHAAGSGSISGMFCLGQLLAQQGRASEGLKQLEKVRQLFPKYPGVKAAIAAARRFSL